MQSERAIGHPELNSVCGSRWKSHRTNVGLHMEVEYNTKDLQRDAVDRHGEVMRLAQTSEDLIS